MLHLLCPRALVPSARETITAPSGAKGPGRAHGPWVWGTGVEDRGQGQGDRGWGMGTAA